MIMKKIFVEKGKGTWGFIILLLLFIPSCIFKILHNLKVYTHGRYEERFKKSHPKILN